MASVDALKGYNEKPQLIGKVCRERSQAADADSRKAAASPQAFPDPAQAAPRNRSMAHVGADRLPLPWRCLPQARSAGVSRHRPETRDPAPPDWGRAAADPQEQGRIRVDLPNGALAQRFLMFLHSVATFAHHFFAVFFFLSGYHITKRIQLKWQIQKTTLRKLRFRRNKML
jgi:hypothetical protein